MHERVHFSMLKIESHFKMWKRFCAIFESLYSRLYCIYRSIKPFYLLLFGSFLRVVVLLPLLTALVLNASRAVFAMDHWIKALNTNEQFSCSVIQTVNFKSHNEPRSFFGALAIALSLCLVYKCFVFISISTHIC